MCERQVSPDAKSFSQVSSLNESWGGKKLHNKLSSSSNKTGCYLIPIILKVNEWEWDSYFGLCVGENPVVCRWQRGMNDLKGL